MSIANILMRVNSIDEFQTYLAIGSFSSSLFLKVPVEHIGYGAQVRLRETWLLFFTVTFSFELVDMGLAC